MKHWLTEKGLVQCLHPGAGTVGVAVTQSFVRINGGRVNVKANTVKRGISGCKHPASTNSKPCTSTLNDNGAYSEFIFINGKPPCFNSITGVTDSVPPSSYKVMRTGQKFVRSQ
jgi:hypothetical protein